MMMKWTYIHTVIAIVVAILVAVLAWWMWKQGDFDRKHKAAVATHGKSTIDALEQSFVSDFKALILQTIGTLPPVCHLFCKNPEYLKLPGAAEHATKACKDCDVWATRYQSAVAASIQAKKKMGPTQVASMVQAINERYKTATYRDIMAQM